MYSATVTRCEERKEAGPGQQETETTEAFASALPSAGNHSTPAKQPLIWLNVIGIALLHFLSVYAFVTRYHEAKLWTYVWNTAYGVISGLGITAGAHRLWAHRSYSAKLPLRIFLAYLYCMTGMTRMYNWIRDHRTHHRFSETDADPHNSKRGFFFSHVGWLMMKRHPAVKEYGSKVDMSDIKADPVVQFVDKYYEVIMLSLCFVLPASVPVYFWDETWNVSIHAVMIRYVWLLNATFLVNSLAHMWGNRPYNRSLKPTENATVSFLALGEGWHNYHHSFPWDYKAAELGAYGLNPTTGFIELMARFGLAYDLKTPSRELVKKVQARKGDGTESLWGHRINRPS